MNYMEIFHAGLPERHTLSCIGERVSFKYLGNEGDKHGILKDRAVIESTNESGAVPYWDVVDLDEFKDEKEPEWIRIGYYRKPKHTLNWGSQTTIMEPVSIWKRIFVNAAQGETLGELKENLNDIYEELTSGSIPNVLHVGELRVA